MASRTLTLTNHTLQPHADRDERRRELQTMRPLQLAGLVMDYQLILDEERDPIELLLDHEFNRS